MSQNIISLTIAPADLEAIDKALDILEEKLAGLIELSIEERRSLTKMGDKSEAFCRQTLIVLDQNRQIIPPELDIDDALNDMRTLDAVRPRFARLRRLMANGDDTEMALGSDMVATALDGYAIAKVFGKGGGLDELREAMSSRFGRNGKRKPKEPASD